ncbi:quinoprotein dehydrogenase-associated SoxYZ-like carrier [Rubrimonas cliftonensis]|uniref:Sulfur-oxidizing protein SoxY n=1 Tax=Rubrimonas cliftonensis TaxID=89524 RepID=A0A1H4DT13_9RHOB|nr:quinoprotein dehydrogenase-associated SoxYZ-like carrier [Rubrimonas cliftonensis]SEA75871.1 sulfur-oxidizing protein SoxY [Rubrimonas cliftonensis]
MRLIHLAAALALASGPAFAAGGETPGDLRATASAESESWDELRRLIFADRAVAEAGEMITLEAPYRAHDAAVVPIEIRIAPPLGKTVRSFQIIIDENPAPVAAEFTPGPGLGRTIELSTRIRVDAYSNVRVIAELDDGELFGAARFVKASGGCSAPNLKDAEAALAAAGQMKLRVFPAADAARPEAQVMLRHPQYSGFQMDQVTHLHIPAYFVDELEVVQGEQLMFRMRGGISLSEDPSIRFSFTPSGEEPFQVRAADTDGDEYTGVFPAALGS